MEPHEVVIEEIRDGLVRLLALAAVCYLGYFIYRQFRPRKENDADSAGSSNTQ